MLATPGCFRAAPKTAGPATQQDNSAPVILSLNGSGQLLGANNEPVKSADEKRKFVRQELARAKAAGQTRVTIRADQDLQFGRVQQMVMLCQKAGFREVELQNAIKPTKKSQVLLLTPAPQPLRKLEDIDPNLPTDYDLTLPAQVTLVVKAGPSGDVHQIVVKTPNGEITLAKRDWREQLLHKIRSLNNDQAVSNKDEYEFEADRKLRNGVLLEVMEVCRAAGARRLTLAKLNKDLMDPNLTNDDIGLDPELPDLKDFNLEPIKE
jgi:biopolymer transport protein ExbD